MNIKIGLWIISMIAVFFLGRKFPADQSVKSEMQAGREVNILNDTKTNSEPQAEKTNGKRIYLKKISSEINCEQIAFEMETLLGNSPNVLSISSLVDAYLLLKNLKEDTIISILDTMNESNKKSFSIARVLLFHKFAELSPGKAMEYFEQNLLNTPFEGPILNTIISSWSKSEPYSAYNWYYQREKGGKPFTGNTRKESKALGNIFDGLAKNDLADAVDKLQSLDLSSGYNGQMAASGIANNLKTPEDFTLALNKVKDFDKDGFMVDALIYTWTHKSPEQAAEWVHSLADTESIKQKAKKSLLNNWLQTDSQTAVNWYMGNCSNPQKASKDIVQNWYLIDLKKTTGWLKEIGPAEHQEAVVQLVKYSARYNPEITKEWINEIVDNDRRFETVKVTYIQMKKFNKDKAEKFLNDSPFADEIRTISQ